MQRDLEERWVDPLPIGVVIMYFILQWEEFFDQQKALMFHLPYMVNTGNHESDSINSK